MTVQTFIIEWSDENLPSMVVAENALRNLTSKLRKQMLELADKQYDAQEGDYE